MRKRWDHLCDALSRILTPKRIAVLLGAFLLATMLPILYVMPYVRATGDDLGYSASVHQVLRSGGGLTGVLKAVADQVTASWYSWQGTWSSIVLFCFQPGLLGDAWYSLTVVIALTCILGGTWYFLWVLLARFHFQAAFRWIAFFLLAVLMIQYMPYPRGGLFWYTSVAHYCIPYAAAMLCMGWSLRWADTGQKRYLAGIVIGMTYLGGAGYPALVLAAVWMFLMIAGAAVGIIGPQTKQEGGGPKSNGPEIDGPKSGGGTQTEPSKRFRSRCRILAIPLLLEMAGFAVSAAAPGNSVRGGEGFGFSAGRVVTTLVQCVTEGVTEGIGYFLTVRPLLPVLVVIAAFAWEMAPKGQAEECPEIKENGGFGDDPSERPHPAAADEQMKSDPGRPAIWQPILLVLVCGGIPCIVRSPELYAGTEVSGGVPDTYWFVTVNALVVCVAGVSAWLRRWMDGRNRSETEENPVQALRPSLHGSPVILIAVCGICLLLSRYLVGASVDYTCIHFISSGALADYREQMGEWLEILNDPEITDAELPAMNDEQGPFMLMVPTQNSEDYTSSVYANYYGKDSVIMVPRE